MFFFTKLDYRRLTKKNRIFTSFMLQGSLNCCQMRVPSVTEISEFPNEPIRTYFDLLISDGCLERREVHRSYQYPTEVERRRLWPHVGLLFDYALRKEIHNMLGRRATDRRAQAGVNKIHKRLVEELGIDEYFVTYDEEMNVQEANYNMDSAYGELSPKELQQLAFVKSYQEYTNPANPTLHILEDIFHTAMLHIMYFQGNDIWPIPFSPKLMNQNNVEDAVKYARSLDLHGVILNPLADCKFFRGDGDILLHDCLIEIKVSKYQYNWHKIKTDPQFKKFIYQMILYAFGFFLRDGREIKKFQIYNPLLGVEYVLNTPNLDFNFLLREAETNGIYRELWY